MKKLSKFVLDVALNLLALYGIEALLRKSARLWRAWQK